MRKILKIREVVAKGFNIVNKKLNKIIKIYEKYAENIEKKSK